MATSDGLDGCLQRGRSQSDPNILTEPGIDLAHKLVDQQRVLRTGCLVSGVHTPPIRRNSKLASLGRIFKPWKWRKKKNEKLKQSSTGTVFGLIPGEKGLGFSIHMLTFQICFIYPSVAGPLQNCEKVEEDATLQDEGAEEEGLSSGDLPEGLQDTRGQVEERPEDEVPPRASPPQVPPKHLPQLSSGDDSGPASLPAHLPNSYLPKELPPRAPESLSSMTLPLRRPLANTSGSPHLGSLILPPMPPSCIMEELQRAFASKNRQESCVGGGGSDWPKKEAEENKENVRLDQCFSNTSGLPFDLDGWNESVISGTLPRRLRKELLAVKLRNRPSKQELEDRNIFPARSDQERQEIRQQIEMKLAKRLSQRPNVEELESRNILKQRNDQTEQEERREIKQRLNRKLNQRPTVDELRDRKILIRFSDYVEVAKAQDYDRRADKPWTRLSAADKAAIRKELNEFKSTEMEVHASSKHLTRFVFGNARLQ
uniref:Phosphatase and actin regulator n=1 Tax=Oryzias latipes TaxID=8090 RepID=A0A3P9KXL6_ORYLA